MVKTINIENQKVGSERVDNLMKLPFENGMTLPKPITYKDIDESVKNFVDETFGTSNGGIKFPTYFFAQQRMSEFTKTWEIVDDNKNVIPDFKIVTRENNPKPGTLQEGNYNIPGDYYITIGTFDKKVNNQNITVSYKMKQPYCVDLVYNIKFITNRLNLLNIMNNSVIDEFKSRQKYIVTNGYYLPIVLEDIGDESDYDLDQRKIFVQNYNLVVNAFIINEKDLVCEENVVCSSIDFNIIDETKPKVINSLPKTMTIEFPIKSKTYVTFKSDNFYQNLSISSTDSNILSYVAKINGSEINTSIPFNLSKYDKLFISIERENRFKKSIITIN